MHLYCIKILFNYNVDYYCIRVSLALFFLDFFRYINSRDRKIEKDERDWMVY